MAIDPKDESLPDDYYEPRNFNPKIWWSSVAVICIFAVIGFIVIPESFRRRMQYENQNYRPGKLYKLETDLVATNRDGRKISFSKEIYGKKAFVAGYQYTDCPSGCLGMAAMMKLLHGEFSEKYPHFSLVSISVNPEGDTPEKMNAWVKERGVDVPNWMFLTGDPDQIQDYMRDEFRFFETKEVTDPELIPTVGPYAHDQRLVLVDEFANVRGLYDVMSAQSLKNRPDIQGVDTFGELEFERLKLELEMILSEFDPNNKGATTADK
ncbi:MAG: SCO family protein [Verrucomicrobiales bacterium]|nr:SCO family protein [Verrucomicrobiales bacterium]